MIERTYFFLVFGLFFTNFSIAQIDVRYGFNGGINLSNGDFAAVGSGAEVGVDTETRTAFYLGGFAEYSLNAMASNLYGQVELQYSGNGFKIENTGTSQEVISRIHQLNLPILLKYELIPQLRVAAGGYLGILLAAQDKMGNQKNNTAGNYKTIDAGFLIGLEVPVTYNLFLEARYNLGLVNVADVEMVGVRADYTNRVLQLGVGYKF